MEAPILQIVRVSRSFGGKRGRVHRGNAAPGSVRRGRNRIDALVDVSFSLPSGAVAALVGGNGAGKSTLLPLIAGALRPDEGEISLFGTSVPGTFEAVRHRIGVLSAGGALYDRLSAREFLHYVGALRGLPAGTVADRIVELAPSMGLSGFLDRRCGTFSSGMRQRTALAATIIHRPELIILDEPTTGLDIPLRREMNTLITGLARAGTTLVIATHHPEEVGPYVTHLIALENGHLVAVEETSEAALGARVDALFRGGAR
jgi:ABC-type multidrug transport system ATPase subunit